MNTELKNELHEYLVIMRKILDNVKAGMSVADELADGHRRADRVMSLIERRRNAAKSSVAASLKP